MNEKSVAILNTGFHVLACQEMWNKGSSNLLVEMM